MLEFSWQFSSYDFFVLRKCALKRSQVLILAKGSTAETQNKRTVRSYPNYDVIYTY